MHVREGGRDEEREQMGGKERRGEGRREEGREEEKWEKRRLMHHGSYQYSM